MKKTIIVGIVLFIVGGLVGFGADRVYMRKKSAANYQQVGENSQEETGMSQGVGMATDTSEEGAQKKETVSSGSDTSNNMMGPSLTGQTSLSGGQNAVLVEDQKPGDTVVVRSVTFAATGWVVVHDDNNGKPGHILGAHRFNAGTYAMQNVELLKATEEGKVYYAMLHSDDGDKQFDYRVDLPVKDETGNPAMARFVATSKSAQ